jgi:AraC-like DNA-binding protein
MRTSGLLENARMKTNAERRRDKLAQLIREHGLGELASAAGCSPDYLTQIIKGYKASFIKGDGSSSERGLGDKAARAIEDALELGRGWFDNDEEQMLTPQEQEVMGVFRQLHPATQRVLHERMVEARDRQRAEEERIRHALRVPLPGSAMPDDRLRGASGFGDLDDDLQPPAKVKRHR